uniref:Uncharacterized protein n=1 Tax=Arundo donax TaxID=35708 RepID=A0A0A8YIK7_ARUDO
MSFIFTQGLTKFL